MRRRLRAAVCRRAEITFRTACAEEAIRRITAELPDMLVGAGTVLTVEQASRAKDAGASFIVSPGLNPEVVSWCLEAGVPVLPGVCTPSDIEKALSLGLKTVKFFPAEASGGVAMLKAMSAPYGDVRFMPTGGINEKNLLAYLSFPKVVACGGSFMVSEKLVDSGDYDAVTALTEKAVSLMLGCRLAHIGVNSAGREEAAAAGGLPLPRLRLRPDGRPRFGVRIGFGDYARRGPGEERTYRRRRQQRRTRDVLARPPGRAL